MHQSAVIRMVVRAGRGERTQSGQTDFPASDGRSSGRAGAPDSALCGSLHQAGPTEHLCPGTKVDLRRSQKRFLLQRDRDER
jgi:hypothetical protein